MSSDYIQLIMSYKGSAIVWAELWPPAKTCEHNWVQQDWAAIWKCSRCASLTRDTATGVPPPIQPATPAEQSEKDINPIPPKQQDAVADWCFYWHSQQNNAEFNMRSVQDRLRTYAEWAFNIRQPPLTTRKLNEYKQHLMAYLT